MDLRLELHLEIQDDADIGLIQRDVMRAANNVLGVKHAKSLKRLDKVLPLSKPEGTHG
jgi:hypothetical protein